MDIQAIEELGEILFMKKAGAFKKLTRLPVCKYPVIGFDTEYTSNGKKLETVAGTCRIPTLLSFQLHDGETGKFFEVKKGDEFTPKRLYQECCAMLGYAPTDIYLAVYFSLAELQFLPVFTEAFRIQEYSRGSTDCSFGAGNGNLHIIDLWRWFDGAPLKKAADALGYEKLEADTWKMTRRMNMTKAGKRYAIHDAWLCWQICHDIREIFLSKTGVDPLMVKTPASASAKAFRAMYVHEEIYCDEDRARKVSLLGLWGGRAEVHRRGKLAGTFQEFDYTGAYPNAALLIDRFPCQGDWREARTLGQMAKMRGGFCKIRFQFPKNEHYPSLGVRARQQTIYPLRGESWCTTYEALAAAEQGAKITILECWGYRGGSKCLSDYLRWTIQERAKVKGAARQMYKLLGNSVVGKLAQRGQHKDTLAMLEMSEDMGFESFDEFIREHGTLSRSEKEALGLTYTGVGPIFMPEWNGLITGFVRAELGQLIKTGEGVYSHTDSIWCRLKPKAQRLPFELKGTGPVTVVRTRFGCIGGPVTVKGKKAGKIHLANHSVWNWEAAIAIVKRFSRGKPRTFSHDYTVRRPLHWCEAGELAVPPGTWITQDRTASTYWDYKRRLTGTTDTAPWNEPSEFEEAHKALQAAHRRHGEYVEME